MLPCEDRYCPPLTFTSKETIMFGKEFLIGTAIVKSLLSFQVPEEAYFQEILPIGGAVDLPPTEEATGDEGDGGIDNEGFVGDDSKSIASKAGSKAKSMLGSVAGTIKSVTFVPEGMQELGSGFKTSSRRKSILKTSSKAASRAPSAAGSRLDSHRGSIAGSRVASLAGSKAASVTGSRAASVSGSVVGSIALSGPLAGFRIGSEAGSFAQSGYYAKSRAGSVVKSIIESKAGSRLQSLLATPSRASHVSRVSNLSHRSVLPTPRKMSMGKLEHSSTIHTHILSNPGSGRKPPMRRRSLRSGSAVGAGSNSRLGSLHEDEDEIFSKSNEELKMPKRKKSKSVKSDNGSKSVTPFKQLMSQKGTPEMVPLLDTTIEEDENFEDMLPPENASTGGRRKSTASIGSQKKSLIEQIATPIRSIGSKIATPLASLRKSARGSPAAGHDPEDIELGMGAEASDFYDQVIPSLSFFLQTNIRWKIRLKKLISFLSGFVGKSR